MPFRTVDPVLTVEESRMRNIDPANPHALFGMWAVFNKCSGMMENGKRLENLSWRLWTHEALCVAPQQRKPRDLHRPRPPFERRDIIEKTTSNVPDLSSSVSSTASSQMHHDELVDTVEDHDAALQHDSHDGSRSREKHLTSLDLENLVMSIKVKQDLTGPLSPLPMPAPSEDSPSHEEVRNSATTFSPRPNQVESSASTIATDVSANMDIISPTNVSETSVESEASSHSVVRGFNPGRGISTYRSLTQLAPPSVEVRHAQSHQNEQSKKKGGMWTLGGSFGDDENSFREHPSPQSADSMPSSSRPPINSKKHASFSNKVIEIKPKKTFALPSSEEEGAAIESDDDDDLSETEEDVSESAIEDDDDDDAWEDEGESEESAQQLTFERVDSKANLVSRRSILAEGIHESQRGKGMAMEASRLSPNFRRSRTSTPNGPSMPESPQQPLPPLDADPGGSKPIIMTTSNVNGASVALSPRATRRNMLTNELGNSLRKHMLNERQQRNIFTVANTVANAGNATNPQANSTNPGLSRRHTSYDVKNLKHYPDAGDQMAPSASRPAPARPALNKHAESRNNSWTDYFDYGLGEYHQKGW